MSLVAVDGSIRGAYVYSYAKRAVVYIYAVAAAAVYADGRVERRGYWKAGGSPAEARRAMAELEEQLLAETCRKNICISDGVKEGADVYVLKQPGAAPATPYQYSKQTLQIYSVVPLDERDVDLIVALNAAAHDEANAYASHLWQAALRTYAAVKTHGTHPAPVELT